MSEKKRGPKELASELRDRAADFRRGRFSVETDWTLMQEAAEMLEGLVLEGRHDAQCEKFAENDHCFCAERRAWPTTARVNSPAVEELQHQMKELLKAQLYNRIGPEVEALLKRSGDDAQGPITVERIAKAINEQLTNLEWRDGQLRSAIDGLTTSTQTLPGRVARAIQTALSNSGA